jgi:RecB family exonuclease
VEHANTGAEEREYGTAVHALLARVDRAEDVTQAVQLAVVRGDLEPTQATELIERLTTALSSPPLSRWFSGVGGARAEAAIITADGSSLRPDRVVEDEQGMHVLEIKTGKPAPAHRTQLSGYMDTLRTMGYSKVEGTIWYLTTGTTEHVIA